MMTRAVTGDSLLCGRAMLGRRSCERFRFSWHFHYLVLLLSCQIHIATAWLRAPREEKKTTNNDPLIIAKDKQQFINNDWLLQDPSAAASLYPSTVKEDVCWEDGFCGLEMSNGLLTRRWILQNPGFGTMDILFRDTRNEREVSILRAIEPEGFITLTSTTSDCTTHKQQYRIGDLANEAHGFRAYLNRTRLHETLKSISDDEQITYRYQSHRVTDIQKPFQWTPGTRHSPSDAAWPPKGIGLEIDLRVNKNISRTVYTHQLPSLKLHYELYDGISVMAKWITVHFDEVDTTEALQDQWNDDCETPTIIVNNVTVERVASFPPYGAYTLAGSQPPYAFFNGESSGVGSPPPFFVAHTDQAHGTKCQWYNDYGSSNDTDVDPDLNHDRGAAEPLLICQYTLGPGAVLQRPSSSMSSIRRTSNQDQRSTASSFVSFKSILLATDSSDMERQTLMKHRMTQVLLPHTMENPLFFHAKVQNDSDFRNVVDQMADVGFEMLIYSFGSAFNIETYNATYLAKVREQITYAKFKGIEVGGYDLICLQRGHGGYGDNIPDEWVRTGSDDSLSPDACFASEWVDVLSDFVFHFMEETGLSMFEADGPYGGGSCTSTNHSHHNGLEDSIYRQTLIQGDFFRKLRERGVYLNVPDNFFYQGQNRAPMGYDESQFSLPRWKQLTVSRMGLYDDLFRYLPTQGWMFVPLTEYEGGGDQATFDNHLNELEWAFSQYLGAGTAACYRGGRLYDNSTSTGQAIRSVMRKWIRFYKAHRSVLIQPIIHLKRPTMHEWDGWLHVRPLKARFNEKESSILNIRAGEEREEEVGLAMIFNPTGRHLKETVVLPLYYTGLTDYVQVSVNESPFFQDAMDRQYRLRLDLDMPPKSIHTIVLRDLGRLMSKDER